MTCRIEHPPPRPRSELAKALAVHFPANLWRFWWLPVGVFAWFIVSSFALAGSERFIAGGHESSWRHFAYLTTMAMATEGDPGPQSAAGHLLIAVDGLVGLISIALIVFLIQNSLGPADRWDNQSWLGIALVVEMTGAALLAVLVSLWFLLLACAAVPTAAPGLVPPIRRLVAAGLPDPVE